MKKRKLSLFKIILIVFVSASCFAGETPPQIYIALGDSVSSGYGLPGYIASPQGKHPSIFFENLKNMGFADSYHNMAITGFTTTNLLNLLNNTGSDKKMLFQNASVVTVNIGGNNLIEPFLAYVAGTELFSAVDRIRRATWFGDILYGFNSLMEFMEGFHEGESEIPSPELEAKLDESVERFSREFEEIILWIQEYAPNAIIIANTVHNPIPHNIMGVSIESISNWVDSFVGNMNSKIIEKSSSKGFLVTDTHSHFLNRLDLMNFNLNPFWGPLSFDIIHPNAEGHRLIARLNYATFVQYVQNNSTDRR